MLALKGPTDQALNNVDDLEYAPIASPGDVVDAGGCSVLAGGDGGAHCVSDIRKVASLAAIANDGDGLFVEGGRNKAAKRHVWALPRRSEERRVGREWR